MLKKLCQCIGLASIVLVMNYGEFLGGGAQVRMHVPFALTAICLAQIADILLLGLALFLVLTLLQRTRLHRWANLLCAIAIPPYLIERTRSLFPFDIGDGILPALALVWAAIVLLLFLQRPVWYKNLLKFADVAGIMLAVFAATSILQILWVMHWRPGPQQHTAAWTQTPQPPRQHPLLVWVIFDELSYDQTFEHRAHDLALPAFDALRNQSTLFTNVQPSGIKTVKVVPSLFTGKVVDDIRYNFDNTFLVHYEGLHGFHPLNGSQTVFDDAQKKGWRTAVVGWYNPYCTIYSSAIDSCYWTNLDKIEGPMAQQKNLWSNILSPLKQVVRDAASETLAQRNICNYDVRQRYQTHTDLERHAFDLLRTDQADFVFLHLAIPHSPNIWSRVTNTYTQSCDSSYLDSLALADRELGTILHTLQSSPRWKDTTLIVQGDHSWRVQIWNEQPTWTDEDEVASHDVFDPRPALIIHQPGQTQPQTNTTAWPLVQVHNVIEQTLVSSTTPSTNPTASSGNPEPGNP